ncbi:MAG: DUF4124 domain-containing protein [Moraxellaceae bacterium]|nr:DUF4124 domain-containing protein [Moraxellaceae bacterium]
MMMAKHSMWVLVAAISAAAPAHAELYKWTDENGRVHYSDRKPGNAPAVQTLKTRPSVPRAAAAEADTESAAPAEDIVARQKRMADIMRDEREAREREQKAAAQKKQELQRRCLSLRDELRRSEGARIYQLDAKGERVFMPDAERDAYVQKMQSTLREHCSS